VNGEKTGIAQPELVAVMRALAADFISVFSKAGSGKGCRHEKKRPPKSTHAPKRLTTVFIDLQDL
jgi:hypothetical protein